MVTIVMKGNDIQYVEAPKGTEIYIVDISNGVSMELHEEKTNIPRTIVKYR